ncbi:MAG TPA: hypothetical protein VFR27_06325 [Mycobacterium sp.]|nr:hypothetical protein [Mycobacterium sp.]
MPRRTGPQPCRWCGRDVGDAGIGRRRQYCRQSCRQRAYEQRAQVSAGGATALPPDAVVLSAQEAAALSDRVYQVRCAAEDIATAVEEEASPTELRQLCDTLLRAVQTADGWR